MPEKKPVKLDAINRKILATIHLQSDITNAQLAEIVNKFATLTNRSRERHEAARAGTITAAHADGWASVDSSSKAGVSARHVGAS